MRGARAVGLLALLLIAGVVSPHPARGRQAQTVVGHSASVSRERAALDFDLADGTTLTIELAEGAIRVNGDSVGSYAAGGALERSWRELLSQAGGLHSGDLMAAVTGWAAEMGNDLAGALGGRLSGLDVAQGDAEPDAEPEPGLVLDLGALAGSEGIAQQLDELQGRLGAIEDLGLQVENGRVHVGDLTVPRGQVIEDNLMVTGGDVSIFGRVEGSLVALDGDVILHRGGEVTGDVVALNGTVTRAGGQVGGAVRSLMTEPSVRRARQVRMVRDVSAFERLGEGLATLLGMFAALASIGFGFTFFMPRQLDVLSETLRESFGKAFLAGLFAQPLLVPAFAMLMVGLAITVVGIIVIPFAIIAFALALVAASVGGYLAAARSVGGAYMLRKMARGELVAATPYRAMIFGLVGLLAIWIPAVLLGWINVVSDILVFLAALVTWAMATAGFGAAILSRAGLRATFVRSGPPAALTDEHYWPAPRPPAVARRRPPRNP